MKNLSFLFIFLATLVITISSCKKEDPDDVESGTATIRGKVLYKSCTTGITSNAAGAEVYIIQKDACSPDNLFDVKVIADSDGNYRFDNLIAGKYVVDAFWEGTLCDYEGYICVTLGRGESRTADFTIE